MNIQTPEMAHALDILRQRYSYQILGDEWVGACSFFMLHRKYAQNERIATALIKYQGHARLDDWDHFSYSTTAAPNSKDIDIELDHIGPEIDSPLFNAEFANEHLGADFDNDPF